MIKLFIGFIFSFLIAFLAYKKKSLSFSGFIGAVILGTTIYYFGGIYLSGIMICFFISSSLLTRFKEKEKVTFEDINEKNGGRDYAQVISNGGLGLIYAFLYHITNNHVFIIAYAAFFAAANSDTWSSEIGILSRKPPISILNFRKIETGMSGGVSLLGTLAGLCGSLFIAFAFIIGYILFLGDMTIILFYYAATIGITGFLGTIIDSYLGALIQSKYKCSVCGKLTEKRVHHDKKTIHISGAKCINNDAVNLISCMLASLAAILLSSNW